MNSICSPVTRGCSSAQIGALVDLMGCSCLPVELARLLHNTFGADHIFIIKVGQYERDLIQSASYDGSDAAKQLSKAFFERKLQRFEHELITNDHNGQRELAVFGDHTQAFASPEFRSFGRETGIGSRFLIRRAEAQGAVAISMLWSMEHGEVSHLHSDILTAAQCLGPIVSRHMAICDERAHLTERLSSITSIEDDLKQVLGDARRRLAQVGARIIAGWSAAEIAEDLLISRETVITYRKHLYSHIGLESGRGLLLWYLGKNLYSFH